MDNPNSGEPDREEIKIALEILRKKWELKTPLHVIQRLIETVDITALQLAERKARISEQKGEQNE